jgi:type IV pilus assembly protein PilC
MVEAGELSGNLEKVLNQLYIQMKKSHQIASKIKGALTYPAVIVVAMIGVITFLVVSVLPQMAAMFKEFEAELPLPTRILIAFSDFVQANGIMMVGGILLFGLLVFRILTTKKGKYYFQAVLLKAPIVSPIIKKINLAKFARTVSSLLKTDIMIVKTFHITSKVLGNLHYRQAVKEVGDKIKKGKRISEIMKEYPSLFPPVVTQISQTGEETGELDSILEELAEFYEGEVDKTMDSLPSIIEPILIIVLGIGVGGVAMAIVMPMYSLTSSM